MSTPVATPGATGQPSPVEDPRRRRAPDDLEQARRRAWGKEWGKVATAAGNATKGAPQ